MTARRDQPPQADWEFGASSEYEDYAQQFGTPYYLYDADLLCRRVDYVRETFGNLVSVYFAVKANPNLELLKVLCGSVDGLDISSVGELEQALLAGHDPAALSFAGPAKTVAELTRAIECRVGSISVESERELRDVIACSRESGIRANVSLRVNPARDPRAFGLKMGGRPLQFGIDEEHLDTVLQTVAGQHDHVEFHGFHVYAGSQGFESGDLADSYRNTLDIVARAEAASGLPVRKINLGGGFGISHTPSGKSLDLGALADNIAGDIDAFLQKRRRDCELIFELGRYLVAETGIYVTRVVGIKESRGELFAITDGGLHHHLAAAGNFGAGFRSNYAVVNLSRPQDETVSCHIAGPSCNPTDLLGKGTELARPREGDLIAVLSSGSYGLTASPVLFLGRDTPAELIRRDGTVVEGRRRRSILDFN